jgi:hypothetical protein
VARVLVLVDAEDQQKATEPSVGLAQGVAALRRAIATFPAHPSSSNQVVVETLPATSSQVSLEATDWVCPLTLNLSDSVTFPEREIYRVCQNIPAMRQRVEQLGYLKGTGQFWLPIVLTAKGPLYAEAIGAEYPNAEVVPSKFFQPLHLSDRWRQSLYRLGRRLLRSLSAPPATYLMQFGFQGDTICFDRLLPFPAAPAIASLGVQSPDLFACHWLCITNQSILDLTISSNAAYRLCEPASKTGRLS